MSQLIHVPVSTIVSLTAERAVELMGGILKAESNYAKLNPSVVTISSRLTVADGGIDAEIDVPPNTQIPTDCFFAAGLTGIQLKSGTSFKPWTNGSIRGELVNGKGTLFPEVARLIKRMGRYVVVCTGHDLTPQQRNDACEQIVTVLESLGVADYRNLVDVLGASQLSNFAERYPGIAAQLTYDSIQEAWVLDEWDRDAHMASSFKPAPAQTELIDLIRSGVEGDAKHIRVLGEPGIGKTRMVLEALRAPHIAPSVLYLYHGSKFVQTALFRQLLRVGWTKPLVLVLDDLSESEMSEVWRHLKTLCGAMKLVTLDHGRYESHDDEILRLYAPRLPDETIRSILADRIGESQSLERWVTICEGSPRVAHAVAENLHANPTDLLRPPATVPLWTRFLHGYGTQEDATSRQVDCVAHHLALFSRFGFEDPVSDEANYVAQLIHKVDPTIGWARFQEIVQSLRARRVLQGSTTLFFVPKALHIVLWKQFWTRYGRGFDFVATFESMPSSLHAWFLNKFRFAGGKDTAFVVDEILKPDGVFSSHDMLTSSTGSQFLSTLAEANSSAVLRLLESTIGNWPDADLAEFKSNRQNIVWALAKIAVWPLLTVRALGLLSRLAVNENADFSNNSTGTLVNLFRIGPEAAATEASPEQRLPALLALLRGSTDAERLLGLKILDSTLDTRGMGFRTVGPEYQGLQERAKLWIPSTYGEWRQAHLLYFQTLINESSAWPAALRPQVCSALLKAVEHQIRTPPCTELALQVLEKLASDSAMIPSQLNKFFWHWTEYCEDEQHGEIGIRIKRLARRYTRQDLTSRFQRYVLDVDRLEWEEEYRDRRDRPASHAKALVAALAQRIAAKPHRLSEISHLLTISSHGPALLYFGEQLAASDVQRVLFPLLTDIARSCGNVTCLHGYLTGIKAQSFGQFELWLLEMLNSSDTAILGAEMTLRSGYNESAFNRCLDALEKKWIEPTLFGALQFGRALDSVPTEKAERLFRLIRQREIPEALQLLIGLMSSMSSERPMPCGPDFAFDVARHAIPLLRHPGQSFGFNWKRVCSRLVKSNVEFAAPLLDALLTTMGEQYQLSYDHDVEALSNELVSIDPEGAWQVTANHFEATLPKWRSDVYNWLKGGIRSFREGVQRSPIANLPEVSILGWIESDPDGRAALIAHATLPTLDDEGGLLTRQLLTRYGHIDGVRSGISASFHSGSWVGPTSQHLKHQRDILRRWLTAGFDFQVAQWIETEIEQFDREIQREEINEERDRFD
ncbi:ATP-binding protein [Limnohabitans sp. 2KL-17]|uniref:ATP-binding protein n=1 Tax=Limnohabitans sp. 2KL-17 TaxID=1100704 RepID=UPI0011B22E22|nr:ATP-binding protein [Limnohabitans sp. 2KL-17]